MRCLVDWVMSNVHGETKQVEHHMKFRRTTITVLQSEGFSNSNQYQEQVTSCHQIHNSSQCLQGLLSV